ncbi:2924_t:CDS:2 [Entrophospora sp. SA101]|nr:2924_t:CDS:2 [Entrophospora sp. SA101]
MLTNIWFFKKLWIPILFRENVLDDAGVPFGFYFTYVLKYHANIPSYILPTHDEESWGDRNSIQQSTCEDLQSKLDNNAIWNNQIEHGYPLVFKESLLKNTELNRILFVIDGYYQEKMFRPLFCRLSLINDNLINVVVTGNSRGMSASKLRSSLVENQYSECKNIEIYDLDIKTDSRNRISRNDDIELKIKVFHGVGRIIQFLKPEVIFYSKIAKDEVIQGITIAANEIKNITKIQLPLDEVHYAIDIIADLPFKALKRMSASKLRSSLVENQYSECKNIEIYDLDIKTDSRNRISRNDDIELKIKVFHGVGRIIQFLKPEVIFYSKIAKDEVIQGITIAANEIKNITKIQLPLDEVHYAIDIIADLPFKALKSEYRGRYDLLIDLWQTWLTTNSFASGIWMNPSISW